MIKIDIRNQLECRKYILYTHTDIASIMYDVIVTVCVCVYYTRYSWMCHIFVVIALDTFKPFFSLRSKFPQKDLEMLFPGMSADFTSENFSAAWYLIENHSTTRLVMLGC